MTSSFFYLQAEKDQLNERLMGELESWSSQTTSQVYVVDRPLGDDRYEYSHTGHVIILSPGRKICLLNFSPNKEDFEEFVEDFVEDIGSISDKFEYKDAIGRPRKWRSQLIVEIGDAADLSIDDYLEVSAISDPSKKRLSELVISLVIGSINDIDRATADVRITF